MIHQAGVIHRDLKPSNVLLAVDGPRVIDFGIARAAEATSLTRTGMRLGSPGYMAPEQVRGGEVTPAADIFALGGLAAFAATGRPPFGLGSEEPVLYRVLHEEPDLAGCPEGLRSLLAECLAKDPSVRPSPAALIEACADRAPGQTVEFTEAWLPPPVVADLGRHAEGLARSGLARAAADRADRRVRRGCAARRAGRLGRAGRGHLGPARREARYRYWRHGWPGEQPSRDPAGQPVTEPVVHPGRVPVRHLGRDHRGRAPGPACTG